jgi:hypothetical protein
MKDLKKQSIWPDSFNKKEREYISKILFSALFIWFCAWILITIILILIMSYNSDNIKSSICTPSKESQQIIERLESIDRAVSDFNMHLQQ